MWPGTREGWQIKQHRVPGVANGVDGVRARTARGDSNRRGERRAAYQEIGGRALPARVADWGYSGAATTADGAGSWNGEVETGRKG